MTSLPRYVEIETSRYCNRLCAWCPNSVLRDRKVQQLMDLHLFESILMDLAQVEYDGWLAFHNYNEPLANPRIFEEIQLASKLTPNAKLAVYSNGDLLNLSTYRRLVDLGIRELRVTRYPRPSQIRSHGFRELTAWIRERPFLNELDWLEDNGNRRGAVLFAEVPPLKLIAIAPKVQGYYDRGGILTELSGRSRSAPCNLTSHSLSIDYLGRVKMCCNIVPDAYEHSVYVLGDSRVQSALDVWRSKKFNNLRNRHLQSDWSESPLCETCTQNI